MFKRIYRHYNLLIDICFWILLYGTAKRLLQDFGVLPTPFYPNNTFGDVVFAIHRALVLIAVLLLPVLLFVKRFRDEYADQLWQKASRVFVKTVLIFPFLWSIGWNIAFALNGGDHWLYGLQIPAFMELTTGEDYVRAHPGVSLGVIQLIEIDKFLLELLIYLPLLFAGIYKWFRWRDGRA